MARRAKSRSALMERVGMGLKWTGRLQTNNRSQNIEDYRGFCTKSRKDSEKYIFKKRRSVFTAIAN